MKENSRDWLPRLTSWRYSIYTFNTLRRYRNQLNVLRNFVYGRLIYFTYIMILLQLEMAEKRVGEFSVLT